MFCVCYDNTYLKIGTIQGRLAWPHREDDTQICEAFQIIGTKRGRNNWRE